MTPELHKNSLDLRETLSQWQDARQSWRLNAIICCNSSELTLLLSPISIWYVQTLASWPEELTHPMTQNLSKQVIPIIRPNVVKEMSLFLGTPITIFQEESYGFDWMQGL